MADFSENEQHTLKNCSLLSHFAAKDYDAFIAISSRATFATGDTLLSEGESSDDFFIIIS
ncbi:MAG: hypothetical protein ACRCXC_07995 [Legionella sp.]